MKFPVYQWYIGITKVSFTKYKKHEKRSNSIPLLVTGFIINGVLCNSSCLNFEIIHQSLSNTILAQLQRNLYLDNISDFFCCFKCISFIRVTFDCFEMFIQFFNIFKSYARVYNCE